MEDINNNNNNNNKPWGRELDFAVHHINNVLYFRRGPDRDR
jgi:hypothetical protein